MKIKSKKWNKVKGKGLSVPPSSICTVLETQPTTNQYKVEMRVNKQDKVEWVSVSEISSLTRVEEKLREKSETVQGILQTWGNFGMLHYSHLFHVCTQF